MYLGITVILFATLCVADTERLELSEIFDLNVETCSGGKAELFDPFLDETHELFESCLGEFDALVKNGIQPKKAQGEAADPMTNIARNSVSKAPGK